MNKLAKWLMFTLSICAALAHGSDKLPEMPEAPVLNSDIISQRKQEREQAESLRPKQDDLLRQTQLKQADDGSPKPPANLSDEELLAQPQILEKLLVINLLSTNVRNLEHLSQLYVKTNNPDPSLLDWAQAALLVNKNLKQAIRAYRSLSARFPNNTFIRFQLAALLYQNQEFEAAKSQFEKLRAADNMGAEEIATFDQYLQAIANKEQWNFSLDGNFLRDKNMTELADTGTQMVLDNGGVITQSTPKESGSGIGWNLGASRQWSFDKGRFSSFDSSISHKYYWNNKKFNELGIYASAGYGYADARTRVQIAPYFYKRLYAGGMNNNEGEKPKLHSYTDTLGVSLSSMYWMTPKLRGTVSYSFGKDRYSDDALNARNRSSSHSLGGSMMYLRNPKQYFGVGLDISKRNAVTESNSYKRPSARVFWGQEWVGGISTNLSFNVAKRQYDGTHFVGLRQENKEYNTSLTVWHKALHFKGFTPKLNVNWHRTKSNIPIYSYRKNQAFIQVEKSF
ncbi:porin family protein [Alysiella filiformis]|uniref:Tetratricopeptide repeat-containing protein n=1 Tax=Alysiella filiformis DSM 16848 TaxID=1120981 RepID=A0A286EX66_9NEIS|nr:porin family protein [Alysiella filiformis]QMT31996.1 DUF560 domain-containing protein [Alysiella filiformis]UBQ57096.1 surface lipoprotein assembly modifier [Alysiella filiformis DSM 16848]SOD75304.1 Protein of unknown function [Alysiella filiformis DSM 16848]